MPTKTIVEKVECLNPNTGGKINIDKQLYDLFSKAIHQTVKKGKAITFTQMVDGVHTYLQEKKVTFDGSVSWYTVTIKNNMESRGAIETFTDKGKKWHRLKK